MNLDFETSCFFQTYRILSVSPDLNLHFSPLNRKAQKTHYNNRLLLTLDAAVIDMLKFNGKRKGILFVPRNLSVNRSHELRTFF